MRFGSNRPMVERNYKASHPFQWVREIVTNSIQANADKILFTTEWQAVAAHGVHRRIVIDNGHGIAAKDMTDFISTYGGSGKIVGATNENYGVGLKSSTLPWNRYGLVVISKYTPTNGPQEHSLVWMMADPADPEEGEFGPRLFTGEEQGDPEAQATAVIDLNAFAEFYVDESEVDWTKVFPGDHDGVAVVFMGNSPTEHTILGDPSQDEADKYGIVRYCDSRFFDLPKSVEIKVMQYEFWGNQSKWPSSPEQTKQHRIAKGLNAVLDMREVEASGSIPVPASNGVPGATISWILYKEMWPDTAKGGLSIEYPLACYAFSSHEGISETYDLVAAGGMTHGNTVRARMSRFVKIEEIFKRLAIIITPDITEADKARVFPDASRTHLYYRNLLTAATQEFSWDYWVEKWQENVPQQIQDAVNEYYKSLRTEVDDSLSDEDYKRIAMRYLSALKARFVKKVTPFKGGSGTASGGGSTRTGTHSGGGSSSGPKPAPKPKKKTTAEGDKTTQGKETRSRVGLVEVRRDALGEEHPHIISFDEPNNVVTINTDSAVYQRCMKAIKESREAKKVKGYTAEDEKATVYGVHMAMQVIAATAVTEALTEALGRPTEKDVLLSDAALSTCLMGIHQIEAVASGYFGSYSSKLHAKKAAA